MTLYLKEKLAKIQEKSCNQLNSEATSLDPYSNVVCLDILNNMERVSNEVYMKTIKAFKDSDFKVSFVKMLEARRGPILGLLSFGRLDCLFSNNVFFSFVML